MSSNDFAKRLEVLRAKQAEVGRLPKSKTHKNKKENSLETTFGKVAADRMRREAAMRDETLHEELPDF